MKYDKQVTVLYAPNIHTGGGMVLLRELIQAWPKNLPTIVFLDGRIEKDIGLLNQFANIYWVYPSLWSRIAAEYRLWRIGLRVDLIFCCNGLPPLLPSAAKVVSNLQNINYLKDSSSIEFSKRVAVRLFFERLIFRLFNDRIDEFIVQTQSMKSELVRWREKNQIKSHLDCIIFPYSKELGVSVVLDSPKIGNEWDFIYISDGVAHKNHRTLFDAWGLLAADGIFPTLAITLSPRDSEVEKLMVDCCAHSGAKICNLGYMEHDRALDLYARAQAIIYPSLRESFGLPLIEANSFRLPILAPELDYVRDICSPVQTFDPTSPLSIVRAVKRFLGVDDKNNQIHTPSEFVKKLLESSRFYGS